MKDKKGLLNKLLVLVLGAVLGAAGYAVVPADCDCETTGKCVCCVCESCEHVG